MVNPACRDNIITGLKVRIKFCQLRRALRRRLETTRSITKYPGRSAWSSAGRRADSNR
ncbi:hypothetical protein BN903_72 [Halorubrum sp. AJ67]|nr:hypothetical protein BN903_72 [Halorubrum sp. AJ67]